MFGYIQIDKPELKLREYTGYRAFYCGLCRSLQKNYGKRTKFLLNYDCTFAALLLSLVGGADKAWIEYGRCMFHPLRKKDPMIKECRELKFASALNVILAYYNLEDKWHDDRKILARLGMLLYKKPLKKAAKDFPAVDSAVRSALLELQQIEEQSLPDIDSAANASGRMLSEAVGAFQFENETERHIMQILTHNLGRWIYIADAWNDREKDKKHGSYNPVVLQDLSKESVMHLLYTALGSAKEAYDLLRTAPTFSGIADNIFERGCMLVTERVLSDSFMKKNKQKNT